MKQKIQILIISIFFQILIQPAFAIWNPFSLHATLLHARETSVEVNAVVFSPEGLLVSAAGDSIEIWDPDTALVVQTISPQTGLIESLALSKTGLLASGGNDNRICIWNFQTGERLHSLNGHTGWVMSLAFSSDGDYLASGSFDHRVKIWNPRSGELRHDLQGTDHVSSVVFSPDSSMLFSGDHAGFIRRWNPASGLAMEHIRRTETEPEVRPSVMALALSPDLILASGDNESNVLLSMENPEGSSRRFSHFPLVHPESASTHDDIVRVVAFSPSGDVLASAGNDRQIKLWDTKTCGLLQTLAGHTGSVTSLSFSSDGETLASGSEDGTVKVWKKPKATRTASGRMLLPAVCGAAIQSHAFGSGASTVF